MNVEYTGRIAGETVADVIAAAQERASEVFGERKFTIVEIDFFHSLAKKGPKFEAYVRVRQGDGNA